MAKVIAFSIFLGLFIVALNASATLFWPVVFDSGNYPQVVGVHLLVVLAAGVFSALAAACVQGLLLAVVPAKIFRPVATGMQTILMSALVMLFFLCPLIAGGVHLLVGARSDVARYFPSYWFTGFYERIRPATRSSALTSMGRIAMPAVGYAFAVFALTHLPGYRRLARKLIEAPPSNPAGPGRLRTGINATVDRLLLKDPVQQAVYHFIGQTISRSMKHRLFLAVYAGFGAALVVMGMDQNGGEGLLTMVVHNQRFVPDPDGLLRIPLTLSFVLISGLRAAFNFPAELTANWAFQVSDTNHTRQCLIAMRKWTVVCGIVPLFLILMPLELAFFSLPLVLFQTVFGLTVSILLMEVMFFDFQRIPFTCGYFPEKNNLVWLIAIYVAGLIFYSQTMAGLEIRLVWRPLYALALLSAQACAWLVFWKRQNRTRAAVALDYQGDGDPMIRTLGLTPQ